MLHFNPIKQTPSRRTCAQCGAGQFLDGLSITGRPSVQRGGISAAPGALLEAPPTAAVARRPLCPRGPAPVHYGNRDQQAISLIDSLSPTTHLNVVPVLIMHAFGGLISTNFY